MPRTIRRPPRRVRRVRRPTLSSLLLVAAFAALGSGALACSSRPSTPPGTTASTTKVTAVGPTKIISFAVSPENLTVDKVGLRGDALNRPDGNRDLAFTATIDGPYEAIFVVSTNKKGEPSYGLRADTLVGTEEIPSELGGIIDTNKMTVGIGVVEGGKFVNGESGSAHGGLGVHNLTLYVPNTATMPGGSFVRMYLKLAGGDLLPGPVTPY